MNGIFPVRVPADMKPQLAHERVFGPAPPDHPLHDMGCPVCMETLGQGKTVLVFVGIQKDDRKEGPDRWTTSMGVPVHRRCATGEDDEP